MMGSGWGPGGSFRPFLVCFWSAFVSTKEMNQREARKAQRMTIIVGDMVGFATG